MNETEKLVPIRRPLLPGPNKPCVCGSKKKFKKCCKAQYMVPTVNMIKSMIKELAETRAQEKGKS